MINSGALAELYFQPLDTVANRYYLTQTLEGSIVVGQGGELLNAKLVGQVSQLFIEVDLLVVLDVTILEDNLSALIGRHVEQTLFQ